MRFPLRARAVYIVFIIVIALALVRIYRRTSNRKYNSPVVENENDDIVKRNEAKINAEDADSTGDRTDDILLVRDKEIQRLRSELGRMRSRYGLLLSNQQERENQSIEVKFEGHVPARDLSVPPLNNELIREETVFKVTRHFSAGRSTPANILYQPGVKNTRTGSSRRRVRTHLDIDIPEFVAEGANCPRLFAGDPSEMEKATKYVRNKMESEKVYKMAQNCPMFLARRRYVMKALNKEEEEYPIAFSIVMHNEVEHFERLLRAIYRPQNHYCIHLDKKAHEPVRQAVHAIVSCFPNVFMASRAVDVEWGTFTVVEPELICMEDLLGRSLAWRYFINLTGQEFPLKTNWDLVRILKAFNGSNNMEGTIERRDDSRVTNKPKLQIPVTLTKGSVHIVVTREFVRYVLYNKDAQLFKEWVKDTYVPDETFFSSLNHSPQLGVPGAYLGTPETDTEKYLFIARFKNWGDGPFNWPCHGQRVRYVCVFGVGDLPLLASRPELFANKFYVDYQTATLDCMEELHYNRTRDEALGQTTFDTAFYKGLSFVSNHI